MGDATEVQIDSQDDNTSDGSTETVLTGANESTDTNSNAGDNSSTDDTATDENSDSGEAGNESSSDVSDTYADFTMPEGVELDVAALEKATPVFKDLGLTQEQSQKVIDLYAEQIQAGSQKQTDNFNQLMTDWRTQSSNDKEFGGDKFDESVKVAQSAINKYGTPELKQLLEEQGVGNHPEVIRFMVRVGRTLKEDIPGNGDSITKAEDRVTQMYGDST